VKIGKSVRYLDEDIERWLAERRVDPRQAFTERDEDAA
jgi:predicted DNA-binding transcriptional regulator AlpA